MQTERHFPAGRARAAHGCRLVLGWAYTPLPRMQQVPCQIRPGPEPTPANLNDGDFSSPVGAALKWSPTSVGCWRGANRAANLRQGKELGGGPTRETRCSQQRMAAWAAKHLPQLDSFLRQYL